MLINEEPKTRLNLSAVKMKPPFSLLFEQMFRTAIVVLKSASAPMIQATENAVFDPAKQSIKKNPDGSYSEHFERKD
jgi:hypothetical protein